MPKKSKKTIAVDLDDVLSSSAQAVVDFSNERWGTNLTIDDYKEHWGEMWGIDHKETNRRSEELNNSKLVHNHRHFEDASEVLRVLAKRYKLVILTSRRVQIQKETVAWINKHYGSLFDDIIFSGFYDSLDRDGQSAYEKTKEGLLLHHQADFIIDDQLKHCNGAQSAGVQALLFGDYPWNRQAPVTGVVRVKDWQAVKEYFDALG